MNSMSKYKEINLEEGMPTVDEAMSYLKMSITLCKQNKIGCRLFYKHKEQILLCQEKAQRKQ